MQDSSLTTITRLNVAEDLLKRLPPSEVAESAEAITALTPEGKKGFQLKVDTPPELVLDESVNKMFFKCENNRDGNSYRSPYSNTFYPADSQAMLPSMKIRRLEERAHGLFEDYLTMYYDQGLMNIFFSEKQDGLNGCLLIRKEIENVNQVKKGIWNSINTIDIRDDPSAKREKKIKVSTTIYLDLKIENEELGTVELSGTVKKQKEKNMSLEDNTDETLLVNIGKFVEDVESTAQTALEEIYFVKTRDIVQKARRIEGGLKTKDIGNRLFLDMHPTNQPKIKFITCVPIIKE